MNRREFFVLSLSLVSISVFTSGCTTTLVPPGWRAEVDEWLNIRMHREQEV